MIVRWASIGGKPIRGKWRLFTICMGGPRRRCGRKHTLDIVEIPQAKRRITGEKEREII